MKNKTQIGIALGLMCILLTSAIAIQLNTIEEARKIVGSYYAEQGLKEEVLKWKENTERLYKDLENKEKELERARQESTKENGRLKELQEEIEQANDLLGLTELKGKGIILTLRDSDITSPKELGLGINKALVHDEDLRQIINDIKNSGAEAISINGQRIVSNTAITCAGAIITVNGVKLSSPFEIKAIGDVYSLSAITRPRRISINNGRRRNNCNI